MQENIQESNVIKLNTYRLDKESYALKVPKVIAKIKVCGGALTINVSDEMPFELPTKKQRENLKKIFGIEIELIN